MRTTAIALTILIAAEIVYRLAVRQHVRDWLVGGVWTSEDELARHDYLDMRLAE